MIVRGVKCVAGVAKEGDWGSSIAFLVHNWLKKKFGKFVLSGHHWHASVDDLPARSPLILWAFGRTVTKQVWSWRSQTCGRLNKDSLLHDIFMEWVTASRRRDAHRCVIQSRSSNGLIFNSAKVSQSDKRKMDFNSVTQRSHHCHRHR